MRWLLLLEAWLLLLPALPVHVSLMFIVPLILPLRLIVKEH
jgi:hypothetical protein